MYHTVWMREHNRLAGELGYLNPHWSDEKLFQEARRILIAELQVSRTLHRPHTYLLGLQHITYNEWLPIVLGPAYMAELDILPGLFGHSNKYDSKVDPTIINSFATAAFRFGHTLIQGMLE